MIKKYKTEITIFLSFFLLYFILGCIFSYYLGTFNFWNVLFDLDTPRVFGDLSIYDYNHYRVAVHPLFVILLQPVIFIINIITHDSAISILLLQSILSAFSTIAIYLIIKKFGIKNKLNIVLTLLFGLSFGQIVFTANIETYIFAQFFLVLLWLFVACKIDKKLKYWDYVVLVLLGIGSIAITLTNFVQYIIAIFFLIIMNKNIKNRIFTSIFLILITLSFSVLLAEIQNIIWPTAPNFFTKGITDLIYGGGEESLYIDTTLSFAKLKNVVNASFANSFNLSRLIIPGTGIYLTFKPCISTTIISFVLFVAFIFINAYFMYKTKFNIDKHKLYYCLIAIYIFNFILHLFYGNSIAFLYVCHYNFSIVLILAYILHYFKLNDIDNKWLFNFCIILIILLFIMTNVMMYINLSPIYNHIKYFRFLPVFIIIILFMSIFIIIFNNNIKKIISIILMILFVISGWYLLNHGKNNCGNNCDEFDKYNMKLEEYEYQLKDMKNTFSVKTYSDINKPIRIFYFGMADRRKILYKDGKLIDIKTKKILKKVNYKKELIIPNEYTVLLIDDDNNIYKIMEDEDGIIFSKNGLKEVIDRGTKDINLPEFNNYKYSEILKVLHQEILFNIDGDIPKPNIFGYSGAWYRDSMLATMVLEETKNLNLFENWVNSITNIYDNSRDPNINEADNLGELLYIIGAVNIDRQDLINDILLEINNIKNSDGSISGMVDGTVQSYYPTVLALYGAKKNNINIDLVAPTIDDGYAKLTWYYDNPIASQNEQTSSFYPYINWAFYNYSNYGDLYILDELYPISYEGGNTSEPGRVESECFISNYYCERNLYISHMWHASEMFLFLKDFK